MGYAKKSNYALIDFKFYHEKNICMTSCLDFRVLLSLHYKVIKRYKLVELAETLYFLVKV